MDLLAQMKTFVSIVDSGSLSAAARAERLSLAGVSRQLSELEAELGVSLIARSTRRLRVTEAGRVWYERSLGILRAVEDAKGSVGDTKELRGRLVVSAPVSIGLACVAPELPRFSKRHPRVNVELRLEDRPVDLIAESVDVAIRGGLPAPDSTLFVAHRLMSFRRVAVAAPTYLRAHGKPSSPTELPRHSCLLQLADSGSGRDWVFTRGSEVQAIGVSGSVAASAPLALLELALRGAGIAYLPTFLVDPHVEAKRLRRVLPGWQSSEVLTWAIHRAEHRDSKRVRAFLEELKQSFQRFGENVATPPH